MRCFFIQFLFIVQVLCDNFTHINLPDEHIPYYFHNFPRIADKCKKDPVCPYKKYLEEDKCWGYEYDCELNKQYSLPYCPGDHKGWVQSKQVQHATFYTQADFGYVKEQIKGMKILCDPLFADDSSLECSEHLKFCRGRNIMINFTRIATRSEPIRYKMDVLQEGDIGGYCDLHKDKLMEQADHISPLQSWGPEMRYFTKLERRPILEGDCDIIVDKPTFILKIDASVNMYHHFCDFLNLYASLHINARPWNAFSTDVHFLIWESYTYGSAFQETFEAFTTHPIWDLKSFRGDVVCFKNVVFPLLPRMIFGLYYNTPIIYGCERSGLFHAFSNFILHRLKIPLHKRLDKRIRITWLSRDTSKRRILNEDDIIKKLKENKELYVKKVVYSRTMNFKKQLEITRNSDILIGIHGAGLTHLLFLPDWAAVFEAYNCEDPNCYMDLARLRGVKYITWENIDKLTTIDDGSYTGGAPAKFVNYKFNVDEFVRLVKKAAEHVKSHPKFKGLFEEETKAFEKAMMSELNILENEKDLYNNLANEDSEKSNDNNYNENTITEVDISIENASKIRNPTDNEANGDIGDAIKNVAESKELPNKSGNDDNTNTFTEKVNNNFTEEVNNTFTEEAKKNNVDDSSQPDIDVTEDKEKVLDDDENEHDEL